MALAAARTTLILAMIAAGADLRDSQALRPVLWGQLVIFASAWLYTLTTQGFAGVQERLGHPYYYVVSLGLVAVVALWFIAFWRGGGWWRWPAGTLALATLLGRQPRPTDRPVRSAPSLRRPSSGSAGTPGRCCPPP